MNMGKFFWIIILALGLLSGLYYRYHKNAADERGATLLMRSFEQPIDSREMTRLIKHTKDMNEKDKAGQTALFYAVRHTGDVELVRRLIESGADVTSTDNFGRTALLVAVRHNPSLEILQELILHGAPVEAADKNGQTPLLEAAERGTPGMVKLLLRAGANPEAVNKQGKTTAALISENERFTEEEKANYRQALVVLSIIGPIRAIKLTK